MIFHVYTEMVFFVLCLQECIYELIPIQLMAFLRCLWFLHILLIILNRSHASITIQQFYYCPSSSLNGSVLYRSLDQPSILTPGVTRTQCALHCITANCSSFNYDQSSLECGIYLIATTTHVEASEDNVDYQVNTSNITSFIFHLL